VITALGGGLTGTAVDPLAEQPLALVTRMLSTTLLPFPAVKVTDRVPSPPVMVPPTIVHLYTAFGPAAGTEATSPVLPVQAAPGAVIAAEGPDNNVTVAVPVFEHPEPLATVTPSPTGPAASVENVIVGVSCPAVIEPLLIVQV